MNKKQNKSDFTMEMTGLLPGQKFDQGKNRVDLIEPEWLEEMGKVLTLGCINHGDRNWLEVGPKRYDAALLRHYIAGKKGEYYNIEEDINGKKHIVNHWAQVAINALFRMSQELEQLNANNRRS